MKINTLGIELGDFGTTREPDTNFMSNGNKNSDLHHTLLIRT